MAKLTAKQARFIEEYLIDLNASAAARRAGYTEKRANAVGYDLLTKADIQQAIQAAQRQRSASTGITAARVIKEIARIAFSDMRNVSSWGPNGVELKPSNELTDDQAAAVLEVAETSGEKSTSRRIKLHSKIEALEKLAKHLGIYDASADATITIANPRSFD